VSKAIQPGPSEREIRWFGVMLLAVFALFGGVAFFAFGSARVARGLWITGAALFALHTAVPPLRRPLYDVWMTLVTPFGRAISQLILGIIYFGLITPIALCMRLFGRDKLERRFDPKREGYWILRTPSDDTARYFRQS
jgi:hypothetical protein